MSTDEDVHTVEEEKPIVTASFDAPPEKAINIAVAARALFDCEEEHAVFKKDGLAPYLKMHEERENDPVAAGPAFPFIRAMQEINQKLKEQNKDEKELFNVILMSHNSAEAGIRLIKSINHHKLGIERVCLTDGSSPVQYLKSYNITMFLSMYKEEVIDALHNGIAAATFYGKSTPAKDQDGLQLRIAFDLDAVLFSDQSERVYKASGLPAFHEHEQQKRDEPLDEGPLKNFAMGIGRMQKKCDAIRTYIVTSRGAAGAGERALKTLRAWGLRINETHFLSGAPKGPLLAQIDPHIYFDDQKRHVDNAQAAGVPAGHVPYGVAND